MDGATKIWQSGRGSGLSLISRQQLQVWRHIAGRARLYDLVVRAVGAGRGAHGR
jgi:hypothetical protein